MKHVLPTGIDNKQKHILIFYIYIYTYIIIYIISLSQQHGNELTNTCVGNYRTGEPQAQHAFKGIANPSHPSLQLYIYIRLYNVFIPMITTGTSILNKNNWIVRNWDPMVHRHFPYLLGLIHFSPVKFR